MLIVPLFYKVEPLDNAELLERMKRLADGTGLTIEGVYRLGLSADTSKANAMLAGLGRTRRVLMGDTLLDKFSPDEIEVIFAHEIGHHVHRHIPKMIATGVVISLRRLLAARSRDRVVGRHPDRRRRADQQPAAGDVHADRVHAACSRPLQNAISRHYERQCDRYALGAPTTRRLPLRIPETGPAQQSRHGAEPDRSDPAPQPPADRQAIGDGRLIVLQQSTRAALMKPT